MDSWCLRLHSEQGKSLRCLTVESVCIYWTRNSKLSGAEFSVFCFFLRWKYMRLFLGCRAKLISLQGYRLLSIASGHSTWPVDWT